MVMKGLSSLTSFANEVKEERRLRSPQFAQWAKRRYNRALRRKYREHFRTLPFRELREEPEMKWEF
jgi:hypothetical protein